MKNFWQRYKELAETSNWPLSLEREVMVKEIGSIHSHFLAEDLKKRNKLAKIDNKIFREVLENLLNVGLIRKVFLDKDKVYFEHVYGHAHHDHLICVQCGKIEEFWDEKIEKRQLKICKTRGYKIIKHNLNILGVCSECQLLDKKEHRKLPIAEEVFAMGPTVPLAAVPSGNKARIVSIMGGRGLQHRLRSMGIIPGAEIKVLVNRFAGSFLVAIKGSKLALCNNITHNVVVENLGQDKT